MGAGCPELAGRWMSDLESEGRGWQVRAVAASSRARSGFASALPPRIASGGSDLVSFPGQPDGSGSDWVDGLGQG